MEFLNLFRQWQDVVEHDAEAVIYLERDPADVMYVILEGQVELQKGGKRLSLENEGGIIGEMAMVESGKRNATAIAATGVKLACMDAERVKAMVRKHPEFSLHLMSTLANRLRSVDDFVTHQFQS